MPTTDKQVRERIEAICATITGIDTVLTREESEITDAMLPAIQVWCRGQSGSEGSAQTAVEIRTFDILLYVERCAKTEQKLWEQVPAVKAAEAWLYTLPNFFRQNAPRLELNHEPLADVMRNPQQLMSDDGVELLVWHDFFYGGITHHLNVRLHRS